MTPTPLYWPQTNIQLSLHLSLVHLHSISISRFRFFILLRVDLHLTIPLALAPQLITGECRISSLCNHEPAQLLSLGAQVGTWSFFCKLNIVHYKSRMCSLFCTHPAAPLDLLFTRLLRHLFHAALHESHYWGFTPIQQQLFPGSSTLTGRLQVLFSLQDFLLQPQITFPVDKSNSVAAYPTLPAHPETPIFPLKGQHLTPPSCTADLKKGFIPYSERSRCMLCHGGYTTCSYQPFCPALICLEQQKWSTLLRYGPKVQKLHSEESIQTQAAINDAQAVSVQSPALCTTQKDPILTKKLKSWFLLKPLKERLSYDRMCRFSYCIADLCCRCTLAQPKQATRPVFVRANIYSSNRCVIRATSELHLCTCVLSCVCK